ncbi:facilitated trehalose transporter Tret1-like isoform X2 [Penaeus japonicus]|nr:facilitated trehalose transporter Tret1-like isoform X2 [Penaeus japonicus]
MMTSWGFPAVALPEMILPDSKIHFQGEQSSWFASVPLFMCIPGSLLGGLLCEKVGPRRLQLFLAPVLCASLMVMNVASWQSVQEAGAAETILLVSRVIQGTMVAFLFSVMSVYPCEISDERMLGTLTSLTDAWASLGLLLCYLLGRYLSWPTLSWVLPLMTLVPGFLGLLISLESPLWMARKGLDEEARETLIRLRGTPEEVNEELRVVRNTREKDNITCFESIRMAARIENVRPMVISALILVMKQISGSSALMIYIVKIFQMAGVGLDPHFSSVLVGIARLSCNFLGSALILRLPRKALLISGNITTAITTTAIATFFFLQSRGDDISWLSWLPVVSLILFMIGYSAGISPSAWLVSVEILPGPVRSLGFGVGLTCYAISSFVVSKTFEDVAAAWGLHGLFWAYAAGSLSFILLLVFFVPETRGRSRQEIEDIWYGKREEASVEKPVP